jgi:cytochrome c oxidase subunit 2
MNGSVFTPFSPNAVAINNLFLFIIVIAGIIFVGVEGALIYSVFNHRQRPDQSAAQFTGNLRLEIIWTAIPALILVVVFYLTLRTIKEIQPPSGDPLEIQVVGHQWWWEINYPNEGVSTANELHVPVGETVIVHVRTADVIHSFWPPSLTAKQDLVPGRTDQTIWFQPTAAGVFRGACAEFCGVEHTWMQFRIYVDSPADYQAWVKTAQQLPPAPTGLALRGQQIYQAQSCGQCHAIAGSGSNAVVGPNLTHVASRWSIGAGVLDNTPENMQRWLANPQEFKPGAVMPNYRLSPDQLQALTAYMETLR